ncbi:tetratricopeptide repeat protein [Kitasatospora sp. NPDC088346]|uniref:tetratricopeptide repeat protein n=1 Tax=Kitasatospora sp. NPDC088346 TaxID=3364073 RepID=UPI003812055C
MLEVQARRGEWFCALAWARLLGGQGRQDEALEVLGPYLATGWWTAVAATAELLEGWGRAEEAIGMVRARMEAGHPMALETYTRLLARHGRAEEAFTLLLPHAAGDLALATTLADVAAAAGRHDEAAALLSARTGHRCSDFPWCCKGLDHHTAIALIATIRERQGQTDEAVALLRTADATLLDNREQLAALLARHGRIEELRAYAAIEGNEDAVRRLAEVLEEGGDPEGAIAVFGLDAGAARSPNSAYGLAQLLVRHGRGGEAVDVMRAVADARPGEDWILHTLADLCLGQGRPADGLAHLDALAARRGGEEGWDLFWMRLPLIVACGGVDEAVDRARAHPEGGTSYAAEHIARVLADAGRTEEAVAVLQPHARTNRHALAGRLVDLGRVEEALAVLQKVDVRPPAVPTMRLWPDEPPF